MISMVFRRVRRCLDIVKESCCSHKRFIYYLALFLMIAGIYKSVSLFKGISNTPIACSCRHRVAFIKTHKTAGSTVANIIQRFGMKRGLRFLLPKPPNNYLWPDRQAHWQIRTGETFDLLCNHGVYNKTAMSQLLQPDTSYFTILRHPVSQFLSAFSYYRSIYKASYLLMVPEPDPVRRFLLDPERYESVIDFQSYTNNRMSFDLGIPPSAFKESEVVDGYVRQIDKEFSLVMLVEYFDESLVLLRRCFCWEFEDIVYVKLNVQETHGYRFTPEIFELIKKWQSADLMLYEHFYKRFWREVAKYGHEFWEEVEMFKKIQWKVSSYCLGFNFSSSSSSSSSSSYSSSSIRNMTKYDYTLTISKSRWNKEFVFNSSKCRLLRLNEVKFTRELQNLQKNHFLSKSFPLRV